MKISIVDDIEQERRELRECLMNWSEMTGTDLVITEFQTGSAFIESCNADVPDIVFMDIYMGEENGLDIIAELRKITAFCITIFVTSSTDDALKAFPLHPFDYIVKPWKNENVCRVMTEAGELLQNSSKFVELKVGHNKTRLAMSRICYAVSDNHHVTIVTDTGERIKSYSSFAEVSESLLSDNRFIVCNRGIIVNMDHIGKIQENCFIMENGDSLPLKIRDVSALKNAFSRHIFNKTKRRK